MSWWRRRTKRPELHERYDNQPQPKATRNNFRERVLKYWYTRQEALTPKRELRRQKRNEHIVRDENWRVCSICKTYKPRDEFSYNKVWFHQRNCGCKECKNKAHREYRIRTNHAKDQEYKIRKRKLNIWDQIYFNWQIREVIEQKPNKWYIVKSITSEDERRISTSDNHNKENTNCVRFVKLQEKVQFVIPEEKEEEKPKFELSLDPDEDDEEYYY